MMLCPADTNEKILKAELSGFFGGALTKKMPDYLPSVCFATSAKIPSQTPITQETRGEKPFGK